MWAGYAFATDFRKKRGHAYMLEDQTFTERVQHFNQPGTCIHCHASVYVPYKQAGNGDLIKGFEHYNQMPYVEARQAFSHPVASIDCHAPDTLALRVTRPGFLEGIRAFKASQGVKDYDVNTMATRQEISRHQPFRKTLSQGSNPVTHPQPASRSFSTNSNWTKVRVRTPRLRLRRGIMIPGARGRSQSVGLGAKIGSCLRTEIEELVVAKSRGFESGVFSRCDPVRRNEPSVPISFGWRSSGSVLRGDL